MKKVNCLTLSSMMQDCYRYCTAHTRRAHSPSDDLYKGAIADCFECLSQTSGEGDHRLALLSIRTAVLLLQHIYTHTVWNRSSSQSWRQLTSRF